MTNEVIIFYEQVGFFGALGGLVLWIIYKSRKPIGDFFKSAIQSRIDSTARKITQKVTDIQDEKIDLLLSQMKESTNDMKSSIEKYYEMTNKRMDIIEDSTKQHYKILDQQMDLVRKSMDQMTDTNRIMALHISELEAIVRKHEQLENTQLLHTEEIKEIKRKIA